MDVIYPATMKHLLRKRAYAILFSLIIGWLVGFAGFLAGNYFWKRFGPPATDPDDMRAYLCGLFVGTVFAIGGISALLWRLWPRAASNRNVIHHDSTL